MSTRIHAMGLLTAVVSFAAFPMNARAGGTRIWELAGFEELDKGELEGTTVSSRGEVSLGKDARRLDLEEQGLIWTAVAGKGKDVYLGTGYNGEVFRVRDGKAALVAETGQLIVTALALDRKGDLYIGALPDPVIWKVKAPGKIKAGKPTKAERWAELPEGTKHIWALVHDKDGRILYAGTGPEGKLLALGADAKPRVYLDTEEEHVMSLALGSRGDLLVGTSPGAMLLKVKGPGRAAALADFDATEVKAIAVGADTVFAAVNSFKIKPAIPAKPTASTNSSSSTAKKAKQDTGDGQLFRVGPDGRAEQIWEQKKAHVVSIALAGDGTVFAGLGVEGKVISVDSERVVRTELDLDERQVMALVADKDLRFVSTGDAGAAYAISPARAAEAIYLSPPLDAKRVAEWGRIDWFTRGELKVQARSGNTAKPDASWSDWSRPLARKGPMTADAARYMQLRFSWAKDPDAVLVSAEVAFRPVNLRAVISELDPGSPFPESKSSSDKKENKVSERTIEARPGSRNDSELKLSWKVDNPDGDTLRYRLWYRAVGKKLWRPILREDQVLKSTRYTWNTESVPEGRYQVRLEADDSLENDPEDTLSDVLVSVPVLVDNHQPLVKGLSFKKNAVSGVVQDSFSSIAAISFSLDAGPWTPVFSKDGVFDERKEEFVFSLPDDIKPGPHAVAVRAFDRAGNMGTAEIHIDL